MLGKHDDLLQCACKTTADDDEFAYVVVSNARTWSCMWFRRTRSQRSDQSPSVRAQTSARRSSSSVAPAPAAGAGSWLVLADRRCRAVAAVRAPVLVPSDPAAALSSSTLHQQTASNHYGWWRGVVGSAFRLKWSYSTPGPVSTAMGDCLRAGKPSRCEACQLGRLSLLPSMGR